MNRRRASLAGVASSLFSGASLFLVFRVSIELVGAAVFGSWVMIQSAYLLSRMTDTGIGINMTRLVAVEASAHGRVALRHHLAAGLLLSSLPVILVGLLLIAPVTWLLLVHFKTSLPAHEISTLVWLSFATAVLTSLATVGLSILEGIGGLFQRHVATIASNVVLAAAAYPLIAHFGAIGIGLGYALAAGALVAWTMVALAMQKRDTLPIPGSTREIVRTLWRENLAASGMVLCRMTFEPWTKFLVGTVSGLAAVAALDLAFRVTTQIRVAVQAATQPLLTLGARTRDSQSDHFHDGYSQAHALVVRANFSLLGVQVAAGALIGFLGLGQITHEFLIFFMLLALGNSINSLGVVGYYFDASAGRMARLLRIHVNMMILNLALGGLGAWLLGGVAVVAAYVLSFIYGGFALSQSWMVASGYRWRQLLADQRRSVLVALGVIAVVIGVMWMRPVKSDILLAIASGLTMAVVLFLCFLRDWKSFRRLL
jgi:O-antigen/teichoic acid export membrane protein